MISGNEVVIVQGSLGQRVSKIGGNESFLITRTPSASSQFIQPIGTNRAARRKCERKKRKK